MKREKWTDREEQLLYSIVSKGIADGKTKTAAFEAAAKKIGRSPSACRYRWNTLLKDQKFPKQLPPPEEKELTLDDCINFLMELKKYSLDQGTVTENKQLQKELMDLQARNNQLTKEFEEKKMEFDQLREKYSELVKILSEATETVEQAEIH